MNVRIQSFVTNIRERWGSLDRQQRIKLVGATSLIILTFIVALYIILRPNMVTLVAGKDLVTINKIETALGTAGIVSEHADDGRALLVNEKDKVQAQVILATDANAGETSEHLLFTDALDLMSLGTTESVRKETLVKAKEGEIAKDLEAYDGVESAMVNLAPGDDKQFFIDTAKPTTASVNITTNKDIDPAQAEAIARYVASSVNGLDVENVIVNDQNMKTIYSGDMTTDVNRQNDIESQKKAEIEQSVVDQLSPLFNEIKVSSSIKYDWDSSTIDSKTYNAPNAENPSVGIINSEKTTKEKVEGGTSGQAPGTASNGGTTIYPTSGETQSANAQSNETSYSIDETRTVTEKTGGTIDYYNSSLSVMFYNYVYYDQQTLENNGGLGDLTWEEFKQQTVPTAITVDQDIIDGVVAATGISTVSVTGRAVPKFIDKVETPPQVQEIIMFVVLGLLIILLALLIFRNTQVEEVEEVEPELSVEDLLVSTKVEEISEVQEAEAIKIKQENTMKTQIDKFVTERPDAAAQLLRNWLNEDWE